MSGKTIDYEDENSIVDGILDISEQIEAEMNKENPDRRKLCKMHMERLLRSIYLQNTSPNGLYYNH